MRPLCRTHPSQSRPAVIQQQRTRRPIIRCRPAYRTPVVATSEFWWEDEQEFDALTEILLPKQVILATPAACQHHLEQLKSMTKFAAAFAAPSITSTAEELWQQLGRAGPPLFLKLRMRETLQQCEEDPDNNSAAATAATAAAAAAAASATAADAFWAELTGQSWRTELDYGLPGTEAATQAAVDEQLLVLTASRRGMEALAAAVAESSGDDDNTAGAAASEAGIVIVSFAGWNQGEKKEQLKSWKQLKPQLQSLQAAAAATTAAATGNS